MKMGADEETLKKSNSGKKTVLKGLFSTGGKEKKSSSRENSFSGSQMPRTNGRRRLHSLDLSPPEYKVYDTQYLIDNYLEKEVKYVAKIPNVPFTVDPTRRTEILRVLDAAMKQGIAPRSVQSSEHDAILSLSASNIKLSQRDTEDLILREEIHNIAAVSYIRDENKHLLFLKTADGVKESVDHCTLVVCECGRKEKADELCSIIQQIFNLVYTELTIKFLDFAIGPASTRSRVSTVRPSLQDPYPDIFTGSVRDFPANRPESEPGLSVSAVYVIKDNIAKIRKELTENELRQFSDILGDYRQNSSISSFCNRLYNLYGESRKRFIKDMRPYIPEKDKDYFDNFVEKLGIQHGMQWVGRTASEASSSTIGPGDNGPYSHSIPSEIDEIDRALLDQESLVRHLDASINY